MQFCANRTGSGKEVEDKARKTGGGDAPFTAQFYQGAFMPAGQRLSKGSLSGEGRHILWVTTLLCPINTGSSE